MLTTLVTVLIFCSTGTYVVVQSAPGHTKDGLNPADAAPSCEERMNDVLDATRKWVDLGVVKDVRYSCYNQTAL